MRNPFQTVMCDECEHILLDTSFGNLNDQLQFAKCKVSRGNRSVFKNRSPEFNYCTVKRRSTFPFCFSFKPITRK